MRYQIWIFQHSEHVWTICITLYTEYRTMSCMTPCLRCTLASPPPYVVFGGAGYRCACELIMCEWGLCAGWVMYLVWTCHWTKVNLNWGNIVLNSSYCFSSLLAQSGKKERDLKPLLASHHTSTSHIKQNKMNKLMDRYGCFTLLPNKWISFPEQIDCWFQADRC